MYPAAAGDCRPKKVYHCDRQGQEHAVRVSGNSERGGRGT